MRKLLLVALALFPVFAFAQGFQVNLEGEKQIGMGHTGTGLPQDGAALFFNPGSVVTLPQNYVQAGISPLVFQSVFSQTGSTAQYHSANKVAPPFTFYGTFGPKSSWWKAGLAVYTPFGGLTDWGTNWPGKYTLESLNLKAIYIQPTISFKLTNILSIGGGFVYNRGSVDLTQALPLASSTGQDGQAELKGTGHGYGYNLGVYLKPSADFSVGLTYRSKVNTTINNGNAIFTVPASLSTSFPQPNSFSAAIPLPSTTTIGFAYNPIKKLTLALDVNYVDWSVYKVLAFNYKNNTPTLQDTYEPRNYKNAETFRLGGQYQVNDKFAVRAGGGYATTAVRDGYVTPEAPDANRFYLTGGLGYHLDHHLDVDLSFEYEHLMSRTQTNISTQLTGTFETNVYIPGISLAYHW